MSKSPTNTKIATKEMIVTRNKSAQQRMQLREKDRSMTKLTDLLKAPTRKRLKKTTNVSKETNNQNNDAQSTEYLPNKLRRKFEEKKRVFLRPKYETKTVVKLNKRKMGTPQRGVTFEGVTSSNSVKPEGLPRNLKVNNRAASPVYAELSMEEMVRIVEDTESLDDEDLMEILTCPSPVWWEEPPDKKYIEEAIFTKQIEEPQKPKKRSRKGKTNKDISTNSTERISKITEDFEINQKDDKFLKKRSKLENLLGNIKNKSSPSKNVIFDKMEMISIKTTIDLNNDKVKKLASPKKSPSERRKEKKLSESNESIVEDLSISDDELLKDLENMDIPVGNTNKTNSCPEENVTRNKIKEISDEVKTLSQVPVNLPPLVKCPKIENNASPSINSVSEETDVSSMVSTQEFGDTISDTNIKFISDDDTDTNVPDKKVDEVIPDSSDVKDNKIDDNNYCSDVLNAIREKKDCITVYKIVSNDIKEKSFINKLKNIPEYSNYVDKLMNQDLIEDSAKGQLNSFFKKCKNAYRKKKSEKVCVDATDSQLCGTCEPKKSSIDIAKEEKVKYCLNCSSIFDTDECSYCLNTKDSKEPTLSEENLT